MSPQEQINQEVEEAEAWARNNGWVAWKMPPSEDFTVEETADELAAAEPPIATQLFTPAPPTESGAGTRSNAKPPSCFGSNAEDAGRVIEPQFSFFQKPGDVSW
jgi:hypothetical protein